MGEARGFHAIPYSGTADLLNIDVKGGSNVPGRFFFQVSDARLVRGGCTNDTSLGTDIFKGYLEISILLSSEKGLGLVLGNYQDVLQFGKKKCLRHVLPRNLSINHH